MGLSKSPKGGSLKPLLPVLPETWLVTVFFFFFSNSVSQELPVNSASLSVLQCPHPTTLEIFRSGKVGRIVP